MPAMTNDQTTPKSANTHFRVHLADGSKHDVLAASAADAAKHIEKRVPGVKITKTKLVRGEATQ